MILAALGTVLAAPVVRGILVKELEERTDADVTIEDLSLSWAGRVRIAGVGIVERSGQPLASLGEARLAVRPLGLLTGNYRADLELRELELHLRRDADGTWNLARVLGQTPGEEEEDTDEEPDERSEAPRIEASVDISGGRVVMHTPEGDTELVDIEASARIESLERPAPVHLAFEVRGPEGSAGRVLLDGTITAATDGKLGPASLAGDARLELQALDLGRMAPALEELAPVEELAGHLEGHAALQLGRGLDLSGSTDIVLRDLALRGPREGAAPVRVQEIHWRGQATQASDGSGTQELELLADDFLELSYRGTSRLTPDGTGQVTGALTLAASVARLAEISSAWAPLRENVELEGRISQRIELSAELRERQPTSVQVVSQGGIEDLGARDAAGRRLDLGELASVDLLLDARADLARGDLLIAELLARAGPVALQGTLDASGLRGGSSPGELVIRQGNFSLEADLGRLRTALENLVDLGQTRLGGSLSARAEIGGRGGALDLSGQVAARDLVLTDLTLGGLTGELQGARAADRSVTGSAGFRIEGLAWATGDEEGALEIRELGLELAVQQDASGQGTHRAEIRTDDGAFQLDVQASSRFPDGALGDGPGELTADIVLAVQLARLAEWARPWAAVRQGLEGAVEGKGRVNATCQRGQLAAARAELELSLADLALRDANGERRPIGELSRLTAALDAGLDRARGTLDLESLAIAAGSLQVRGSGHILGLPPGSGEERPLPEIRDTHLELDADLARLGADLGQLVDLGGLALSGGPVHAELSLETEELALQARGEVRVPELTLQHPDRPPMSQRELALDFDLGFEPLARSLECRALRVSSQTAALEVSGSLRELAEPERARADLELAISGELEGVLGDLGLATPGRTTSGALEVALQLEGDQGAFQLTADSSIERFQLELAPASDGEQPLRIEDPRIALSLAGRVQLERLDVDLSSLRLESSLAHGGAKGRFENLRALLEPEPAAVARVTGVTGEIAYVPERVGAVLGPWLPGKLSGGGEKRVSFRLDGPLGKLDLPTLLATASGRADVELGRFSRPDVELGGAVAVEVLDGRTVVRGDLEANGGTLEVDGALDLSGSEPEETPRSTLHLGARELRANPELSPLLSLVHPAFAATKLTNGELDGLLDLSLDLSYDAPLSVEALQGGWAALPKQPINGSGRFELRSARLANSPLLELLEGFGVDVGALDIPPIDLTIRKGRVSYPRPWVWTLSGVETTFAGSVGLDQTLDMTCSVPISGMLIERFDFLGPLEGETIEIPLRGTVTSPQLETQELFRDLALKAAKKGLGSRIGLGGDGEAENDPAKILSRADQLWDGGKKSEAAALYARLRDDFKLSLTYVLNKDRIKERSRYKPQ